VSEPLHCECLRSRVLSSRLALPCPYQVIRIVDVASLSLAAAQCLLDVDLRGSVSAREREETAKKLARLSREQIRFGA